jgi:hypothetical protein
MRFAQIISGVVENVIVLDDPALAPLFLAGYDDLVRIDTLDPEPQIGWTYSGGAFSPGS